MIRHVWDAAVVRSKATLFCVEAAKIIAAIQFAAALVIAAIWAVALRSGQIGAFDRVGLPCVAALLCAMSVVALMWPRFVLGKGRLPLLAGLMAYVQASLFVAMFTHGGLVDSHAVIRLGLAMPLLYLASFALLVRRAYVLPVVQGLFVSLQCGVALMLGRQLVPAVVQSLSMMLLLQPLYLALLYWINHQRRVTLATQEAATASKMTMLALVSHELRSPLQTIGGTVNALERRMIALGVPKAEIALLHRLRSASAQLDSHLNDLMVITKQGGGLAPARKQPFRLDLTLQALIESYVGAARDRDCVLRLEIGPGCDEVEGDALRVHQIINNLVNNAVKYTSEGEIAVEVRRIDVDNVEIVIRDSGIGIPESKIAAIWEPHVRVMTDPQVAPAEGYGLGLTVVRLLVDMLDGHIAIYSRQGEGTEVALRLRLPRPSFATDSGVVSAH
jgi:signal transduction histidine kinase